MSDCIFCKIINGEISTERVYEDENVVAFNDINPQSPVHILVIPKVHISSLNDIDENSSHIIGQIHLAIKKIGIEKSLDHKGYRVVNNCGKDGGQTVDHLHYHILGGREMKWPPG